MLSLRVSVRMKTERQLSPGPLASAATGKQANECLKTKNKGRKEGGQGSGVGKNTSMHCGGWTGLEVYALVQLLKDFVNA